MLVRLANPKSTQYPGGMWRGDTMLMAYSEGKENISVTSFKLAALQGGG